MLSLTAQWLGEDYNMKGHYCGLRFENMLREWNIIKRGWVLTKLEGVEECMVSSLGCMAHILQLAFKKKKSWTGPKKVTVFRSGGRRLGNLNTPSLTHQLNYQHRP